MTSGLPPTADMGGGVFDLLMMPKVRGAPITSRPLRRWVLPYPQGAEPRNSASHEMHHIRFVVLALLRALMMAMTTVFAFVLPSPAPAVPVLLNPAFGRRRGRVLDLYPAAGAPAARTLGRPCARAAAASA
jgi:hypothetical protein